jgi:hypothetical protein
LQTFLIFGDRHWFFVHKNESRSAVVEAASFGGDSMSRLIRLHRLGAREVPKTEYLDYRNRIDDGRERSSSAT